MKNIFRFTRTKEVPAADNRPVVGITESEWIKVHNTIVREREAAKQRQRSADAKPSDFMRGLDFALSILDRFRPHTIKEA